MIANNSSEEKVCAFFYPVSTNRFILLFALATPIAVVGVITNLILMRFFAQEQRRKSGPLYLCVLAFLDCSICLCYILLMGMDALAIYTKQEWLYTTWNYYCIPVFTFSKMVQLASSYIIVAATGEKLILNAPTMRIGQLLKPLASKASRCSIITLVLLTSCVLQAQTFLEFTVVHYPNCSEIFGKIAVEQWYHPILISESYRIYVIYVMPAIKIFAPFFLLVSFNVGIIKALQKRYRSKYNRKSLLRFRLSQIRKSLSNSNLDQDVSANGTHETMSLTGSSHEHFDETTTPMATTILAVNMYRRKIGNLREKATDRRKLREATYTLFAIASSYLICNSLSLFIQILEHLPNKPLLEKNGVETDFYTLSSDLLSFLFMLNSFTRLFIYICFSVEIRRDMMHFFTKA